MRPRTKKNLEKRIDACSSYVVDSPESKKGRWKEGFSAVRVEIGCGKGGFICGLAALNPDILYVGIEIVRNVIVLAAEKATSMGLKNVLLINGNARYLSDYFEEGEADELYLNFSDPWPRDKQHKHRLTSDTFMPLYIKILKAGGNIIQKTDNRDLFDFSVETYKNYGCSILRISYDLHHEPWYEDLSNIVTEYEERFVSMGLPICYAKVSMPDRSSMAEKIALCEEAIARQRECERRAKESGAHAADAASDAPSAQSE